MNKPLSGLRPYAKRISLTDAKRAEIMAYWRTNAANSDADVARAFGIGEKQASAVIREFLKKQRENQFKKLSK
jgi:hypothetical protein